MAAKASFSPVARVRGSTDYPTLLEAITTRVRQADDLLPALDAE